MEKCGRWLRYIIMNGNWKNALVTCYNEGLCKCGVQKHYSWFLHAKNVNNEHIYGPYQYG